MAVEAPKSGDSVHRGGEVFGASQAINLALAVISTVAAIVAVVQTQRSEHSRKYTDLRNVLSAISELEREATDPGVKSDAGCGCESAPCSAEDTCLGSLAMKQAYIEQYSLLALNAHEIAEMLAGQISDVEKLEIAGALYNCGRLDLSSQYSQLLVEKSQDYGVRFKAYLLLSQIHFFKRELDNGAKYISLATRELENPEVTLAAAEKRLLLAQAHLVCGRMHVAMGRIAESYGCQEHVWEVLKALPKTLRVTQMTAALEDLHRSAKKAEDPQGDPLKESFEKFSASVLETPAPEPVPAAPEAPAA